MSQAAVTRFLSFALAALVALVREPVFDEGRHRDCA
jgi:hypothetical protein